MNTIDRVEELARIYHLTKTELLHRCGLNHSTLNRARERNGQLTVPTIEIICDTLGITLKEFFDVA